MSSRSRGSRLRIRCAASSQLSDLDAAGVTGAMAIAPGGRPMTVTTRDA